MGKILRKIKPTEATYFLSESQRKHTSRLSFIHGSPQLVAVISILVVTSVISGLVIINKQNASKAATSEWSLSSRDGFSGQENPMKDGAHWKFDKEGITVNATNNGGENLKISYPAGSTSERGRHACWILTVPGDVTVTSAKFNVTSNAAGSTMVNLQRNETVVASSDRALNNGSLEANFAPSAGGVVQICHKITGNPGEQRTFDQERFMYVNDYVVRGYKTVADTPQATQFGVSGRIVDENGKGVAGIQLSNCQIFPAATTNENGDFGFYVAPGSGYCVRPSGWDYNAFSIVATNTNDGWGFVNNESDPTGNSRSYEGKIAVNGDKNGRANHDFKTKKVSTSTPQPAQSSCTNTETGQNRIAEAENSLCTGNVIVVPDGNAEGGAKAVRLQNKGDAVQFTFTASEEGTYYAVARMRDGSQGQGKASVTFNTSDGSVSRSKQHETSNNYVNYTVPDAKYDLKAGQQAIIRVELISSNNVVVDKLTLVKDNERPTQKDNQNPTPAPTPTPQPQPSTANVIDENRFGAWGFPVPENPKTNLLIEHSNKDRLDIRFQGKNETGGKAYTDGVTACWTTVISNGNTATDFEADINSDHSGRNIVFFRATGNPDKEIGRDLGRHKEVWKLSTPVQAGGTISVCSKVVNPNNQPFETGKSVFVWNYKIYGTGTKTNDVTDPKIYLTTPEVGKTVGGTITLKAEAGDESGIKYVQFTKGGDQLSPAITSAPYEAQLDTTKYDDGEIKIKAVAQDNAGNIASTNERTIKINNGKKKEGTTNQSPQSSKPKPIDPSVATSPSECSTPADSVEAYRGIRKNDSTTIQTDTINENRTAVILFTNGSYVECKLTVQDDGLYSAGALIRSQDYKGKGVAEARLNLVPENGKGVKSLDLKTAKGEKYQLTRPSNVDNYTKLTKGQVVTVRVTFTNDARETDKNGNTVAGKDRNLWVDKLLLVKANTETTSQSASNSGSSGSSNKVVGTEVTCDKEGKFEAEEAKLFNGAKEFTESKEEQPNVSGQVVRITNNTQYIECILRAEKDGTYVLGAKVKSDNRFTGKSGVKFAMANGQTPDKGEQVDFVGITHSGYENVRVVSTETTRRKLNKGEAVLVRVSIPEADNAFLAKKHLLIDKVSLVEVGEPKKTQKEPVDPKTDQQSFPERQGENGVEEVSYNTGTGSIIIKVEAEKASYQGVAFNEASASDGQAVRLFSNKNYVEYTFDIPADDRYSFDFAGRSEDFDGNPAQAKFILDPGVKGKEKAGAVKLKSGGYDVYSTAEFGQITKGKHVIRIEFTNDKKSNTQDRNLIVDYLRLRGSKQLASVASPDPDGTKRLIFEDTDPYTQVIEAENGKACKSSRKAAGCGDLAITDPQAYGGRAVILDRKNDFVEAEFTLPNASDYAIGVTLKSQDYKGSAKADIFIDDNKVASGVVPSTNSYKPGFLYRITDAERSGESRRIKVVFINDLCGQKPDPCSAENDRNLLVDYFVLSDTSINRASQPEASQTPKPPEPKRTRAPFIATGWKCDNSALTRLQLNGSYYGKSCDMHGFPIVGPASVNQESFDAMGRIVNAMSAKRRDILQELIARDIRYVIIGVGQKINQVPEYSNRPQIHPNFENDRIAGLGPTSDIPLTLSFEDNLLCLPSNRNPNENVAVHEFAHAVHYPGLYYTDINLYRKIGDTYRAAMAQGLWQNTYSATNEFEYWAVGVQAYYNTRSDSPEPNGRVNHVNTRSELFEYDRALHDIVAEVFPSEPKQIACQDF